MSTLALTLTTGTYAIQQSDLVGVDTITLAGNTKAMIVSLPFVMTPQAVSVVNNGSAAVVLLRNLDSVALAAGATGLLLIGGNDIGPSLRDVVINTGSTDLAWANITGKPTTFAPIVGTGATDAKAGNYAPPNAGAATRGLVLQMPTQAASVAVDAAGAVTDLNLLIGKLKTAGLMA